jgi:energy-coupling factor transporter ATP-binding protein EcfA2
LKLLKAHVRDYRSVNDSTEWEVEADKTIAVGANEAGKTALLKALQTVNPPDGTECELDALRDYPRARYTEIATGTVDPSDVKIAVATFMLEPDDIAVLHAIDPVVFANAKTWELTRHLDKRRTWWLPDVPDCRRFADIEKDLARLKAHLAKQDDSGPIVNALAALITGVPGTRRLTGDVAADLDAWLETALPVMDADDEKAEQQFDRIRHAVRWKGIHAKAWQALIERTPVFVYFSQIFSVRPRIHLANLAQRQATNELDQEYDFGNLCLLDLLGFTAKELSGPASVPAPAPPPDQHDQNAMAKYQTKVERWQAQLDDRHYRLNAASVALTKMVREVWNDDQVTLNFVADGQYLKVVVQDDLGVEVELDQRSDGFRWLVSFFVVFRAQAKGNLNNAILLLDEPGLSLHALKQQQFRKTVSMLANNNQIIYTTHSPFMVGTDELHLVRVVEMKDRQTGTKVHSTLIVDDPRSIYPLQAALGYELAQSLFGQKRNLVCEGLTDMWLLEGVAAAMREAGVTTMRDDVAITPAQSASKVVYYCALLRGQKLKVAALLDSDAAGDQAAAQDEVVRLLKSKEILRTKDHYTGAVTRTEIEDLLRDTLVDVAKAELGWDVTATAAAQPGRPIVDIFTAEITGFSKYKLAKAFLRWLGTHGWADMTAAEHAAWTSLTTAVNKALA